MNEGTTTITLNVHQAAYLRNVLEPEAASGEMNEAFIRQQRRDAYSEEPGEERLTDWERADVAAGHATSALASSILLQLE